MAVSRRRGGFTLLELIIGILIVSILATMAIPGFSRAVERTKVREAQAVLSAIYSAEKVYRLDQGSYGTCCGSTSNLVGANYLANPSDNENWAFSVPGGGGQTFTATATRSGGGYAGRTVTVTQAFDGTDYGGTHPLAD